LSLINFKHYPNRQSSSIGVNDEIESANIANLKTPFLFRQINQVRMKSRFELK